MTVNNDTQTFMDQVKNAERLTTPNPHFETMLQEIVLARAKAAEESAQKTRDVIIGLIKKDCEHPKYSGRCMHEHIIGEIEAQLGR